MSEFDPTLLTGPQLRAARALVDVTLNRLAERTRLGAATLLRAEKEDGRVRMTAANAERVVKALEDLGVEFLAGNGSGPGVRLRARDGRADVTRS